MALDLPEPIKEFDLGRVGDYLGLAAPQRLFLKEAHARYLKDIEAVRRQTQPQLDAACEHSLMVQGNDRRTFAAVASIAQVYDVEESLRRAIERADEALFVELESVLADVQKPGMARVRDYRQRQACVGWLRWLVRPARIDLSAMLDDVSAVPEVRAAVDGLLADYERRLTPTRVALNKAMLANRIRLLELSAWLVRDENDRPLDPTLLRQRSQEHALRVSALLDDSVRLQRQIADLNQKTLGTLLTAMPPSVATSLRNEYQRRAFPTVYPDPHGLHDVCERLVGAAGIDDAQRAAISALCATYQSEYDGVNLEMERRYSDWCLEFASTFGSLNYEQYRLRMRELRDQRWRLNLKTLRQIESLIPDAGSHSELQSLAEALERAIRQGATDRYPGP